MESHGWILSIWAGEEQVCVVWFVCTCIREWDTALGTVAMIWSFSARSGIINSAKDFSPSPGIWYQLLSLELCPKAVSLPSARASVQEH